MTPTHKVYIAGPEVFLSNGFDQMRIKGEMALAAGFFPSTMAENDLDPSGASAFEFGCQISAANEKMMREADFCIANLTPFRGISADIGTGYEVGFMIALGKPVFGHTNTSKLYYDRLLEDYYGGKVEKDAHGVLRGADGLMIEDHGMVDNLMFDGGIAAIGGQLVRRDVAPDQVLTDLGAYQQCLKLAREFFDKH
jgi:nucleoside 2-deoxyribosyltransferase